MEKTDFAKTLRKNQTEAESFVWSKLRSRRFDGYKFRRQVVIGKYIVDFVCFDRKIVIELDGGQHNDELNKEYDCVRDEYLKSLDYVVLRIWNDMIFNDWETVENEIWRLLQDEKES